MSLQTDHPPADASVEARERRLSERVLEDEGLRGNLEDDGWQPIQDWLLEAIHTLAAKTAGMSDQVAQERLEAGMQILQHTVAERVAALEAPPMDVTPDPGRRS